MIHFAVFIVLVRLLLIVIGQLVDLRWKNWSNRLINFTVFVLGGIIFYLLVSYMLGFFTNVCILLLVAAAYFLYWKMDSFDFDVMESEKLKQKYVGVMFSM
jgi:hypothetical protein